MDKSDFPYFVFSVTYSRIMVAHYYNIEYGYDCKKKLDEE